MTGVTFPDLNAFTGTPDPTDLIAVWDASESRLKKVNFSAVDGTANTFLELTDTPSSLSQGDLLYVPGTGGNIERLAVGPNGRILTVTAGVPAWAVQDFSAASFTGLGDTPSSITSQDLLIGDPGGGIGTLALGASATFLRVNTGATALEYATAAFTDLSDTPGTITANAIYYGSGGNLVALPIGSNDQLLTVLSGAPTWDDLDTTPNYNEQTDTAHTLALTDAQGSVGMNNANANTVTIPTNASVAFPIGTVVAIDQLGAGVTTITAASGVTLDGVSAGSADMTARYKTAGLKKVGTDAWIISGNVGAVA